MLILVEALVPGLTAISKHSGGWHRHAPFMAVRHVLQPDEPLAVEESRQTRPPRCSRSRMRPQAHPSAKRRCLRRRPNSARPRLKWRSSRPRQMRGRRRSKIAWTWPPRLPTTRSVRSKTVLQIMAVKKLDRIAENEPPAHTLLAAAALLEALAA
jgi:hypothetical protein